MSNPDGQNDFNTSNDNNPKYKGVRKRKWGKWVSEIRMPNSRERIWLGSFDSPRKAARAFDAAQFCLRGPHAGFNFPDSPPDIPGGGSLSPHQIQAVATRFANDDESSATVGPPQTVTGQETINEDFSSFSYSSMSHNPDHSDYTMDSSFMDILDNQESGDNNNNNNSGFNYDSFDHFYPGPLYTMHSSEETNYGDDDPHYFSHQYSSSSLWNF